MCGDTTRDVGGGRDVGPGLGAPYGKGLRGKGLRADAHPVGWGTKPRAWIRGRGSGASPLVWWGLFQVYTEQVGAALHP